MKQYRLIRDLLAEKASQQKAEIILGRKIQNLMYGTDGYIIEEQSGEQDWIPASVFDKQAILIDKPTDIYQYMAKDTKVFLSYLERQYVANKEPKLKAAIFLAKKRLAALQKDIKKIIDLEIMTNL